MQSQLRSILILIAVCSVFVGCGSSGYEKKGTVTRMPSPSGKAYQSITWVDLADWLRHQRSPSATFPKVAGKQAAVIGTPGGRLTLTEGTRQAVFNGVNLWLAYGPKMANGKFMVHTADLHKTVLHLLKPSALPQGKRTVLIDPGHGGKNQGARNTVSGHYEKEYTFDLAIRLKPLLEKQGWRVLFTRQSDKDVSLSNRVDYSNSVKPDLFISLHFNSAGKNTSANGIETFVTTPVGQVSTLTRNYSDDPNTQHPNNGYDALNLRYALAVQQGMVRSTKLTDRGVRKARFMTVIRGQRCPAILLEGGFFSNPNEAKLVASSSFRQSLAQSIATALR